ncbi:MAG: hypothetical protein HKN87_07245 [Saprospiraceae bacterium]|nr:hypothetical protein [Saprospiraceae bacterium]
MEKRPVYQLVNIYVVLLLTFLTIGAQQIQARHSVGAGPAISDQEPTPISGGVFIPRNGGIEGRIGLSHVFFHEDAGGVMSVVAGEWSAFNSLAKLDMVFSVKIMGKKIPIEVRQSFDKNPRILFLEEGGERIGLRVLFNLYDRNNTLHGHGMTETWLHPDGQMFVTAATMFENTAAHEAVTQADLDIDLPAGMLKRDMGMVDMTNPCNYIMLTSSDPNNQVPGLSLFWKTGKMEHNTYVYRSSFDMKGAPSYFRWPDYHRQAYTQRTLPDYINVEGEKVAWPPGRGAYVDKMIPRKGGIQLHWPIDQNKPNPTASFNAFFRLAMVDDAAEADAFVEAECEPVTLQVMGGVIHGGKHGYNDQEGCYEIRKTSKLPVTITLPADPLTRTTRIKVVGLTGNGAVTMTLDGKVMVPQLSSDGGIADDPLAPIKDQPEGPATAAVVTIQLLDEPQVLSVQEEEGIQLVYQSRDSRRNFMIYSTKTGPQWSGLQFSLVDGHARHMRSYGNPDWALTENLMHWFAYMGYSPEQMIDQLRDFEIIKNGPDEIVFKYTSNNANDGAQSVFEVHSRANSPAMQINVRATFTVLEHWPYKSVQFFDVFPFRGVEPKDWWYGNVLFMDADYKWRSFETVSQTYDGKQDKHSSGPTFQGLYSSDRGNMLMLTKNFTPELPTEYVICGNYVDLHSNVTFDNLVEQTNTLDKGYEVGVEYELAIWGDEKLSRDQLIQISKQSLEAETLVLPKDPLTSN